VCVRVGGFALCAYVAVAVAVAVVVVEQISLAVQALEELLRSDPLSNLSDAVLQNLRTLYELASNTPALKKRMLDGMVFLYGTDELEQAVAATNSLH
jgi:hypothetical protein